MRKIKVLALILVLPVLLTACGYKFSGEGEGPKPGLKFIAVPVFKNDTNEPNLGALIAGALRREFSRKGNFKVVPVEEAEAVFNGTVKTISISSVAHHPTETIASNRITIENRLYITMDIRCVEKKTGRVLWSNPSFTYYKTYRLADDSLVNSNALGSFERRSADAVDYLAREMAIIIHDRFSSNF